MFQNVYVFFIKTWIHNQCDICIATLKIRHLTLFVEIELNTISNSRHFYGYLEKRIIEIVQKIIEENKPFLRKSLFSDIKDLNIFRLVEYIRDFVEKN